MPSDDRNDIVSEWRSLMNMDVSELEDWLQTDESNSCGQIEDDGEATGHKSGRCVLRTVSCCGSVSPDLIQACR